MSRVAEILSSNQIEQRTIEHIPSSERHGHVRSLLTMWFSSSMNLAAVALGVAPVLLGCSLGWAIAAIVIGNLFGAVFMAYHSAQGPRLGLPQMIQSRAQFGVFGANVPLILVLVMYIGYGASGIVIGGIALAQLFHIATDLGIVIFAALALVIVVLGYDWVHRFERYAAFLFIVVFAILTVKIVTADITAKHTATNSFGVILLSISFFASWQLTYAPYVADYSRYLPEESASVSKTFWYTYIPSVISTSWLGILGAIAAWAAGDKLSVDPVNYVSHLLGGGAVWFLLAVIVVASAATVIMNLYGPFMTLVTISTSFKRIRLRGPVVRLLFTGLSAVAATAVAIWGRGAFLTNFENFIILILYGLVPWTAINLVDFYIVRKGHYALADFYDRNGIYGMVNWPAMGVYVVAVAVQVPFMNSELYEGPLAKAMGGADVAWILGLIVAGGLYWLVARRISVRAEAAQAEALAGVDATLTLAE